MVDHRRQGRQLALLALAALVIVGCGDDVTLYPPVEHEMGTVIVNVEPDTIGVDWTLSKVDSLVAMAAGDTTLVDLDIGNYTVVWGYRDGWTRPDSETLTLDADSTVTFVGGYFEDFGEGTIVLDVTPDDLVVPWILSGPDGDVEAQSPDTSMTLLKPGEYTIAWGDVAGYIAPTDSTAILLDGGTVTFAAWYPFSDAIVIDVDPDEIEATWTLTGPDEYAESGTGDSEIAGLGSGDYTLSWTSIDHWLSPPDSTQTLAAGGRVIFRSVFTQINLIQIAPTVETASWTLDGPDGFSMEGVGSRDTVGVDPGEYTIGWGEVAGKLTPLPETQVLEIGDRLTFVGVYVGAVSIEIQPLNVGVPAPWSVVGPEGYEAEGAGYDQLSGLMPGEYTVTWGPVDDFFSPPAETQQVESGELVIFEGNYILSVTATIASVPVELMAPWSITGPENYTGAGTGAEILGGLAPGSYTVTWGSVADWLAPSPLTLDAAIGDTLRFNGTYQYFEQVAAGSFTMGSPVGELGQADDEALHEVTLARGFMISRYEVTEEWWDDIMGSGLSMSQTPQTHVSWDDAVLFCNLLSTREGLTPAYTIDGAQGLVTWDRDADGFRLPTEAEWEYACRAGSATAFSGGPITEVDCGMDPVLDLLGWYCGNSLEAAETVGLKTPNAWGLYDMHGNLFEWCWDGYRSDYENLPAIDPAHDVSQGDDRVFRGGSWYTEARFCRSASRLAINPFTGNVYFGFRPVRTVIGP